MIVMWITWLLYNPWLSSSWVTLSLKCRPTLVKPTTCETCFFSAPFNSSFSVESIYWLPIGYRSILLKPISFLFLGLCFWVRSPWDCFFLHRLNPSSPALVPHFEIPFSCPSSPSDSFTLPWGNSSIMAGCLTGRGLMTGALYWHDCHTLKMWSQSTFLKPVKLLQELLFKPHAELVFCICKCFRQKQKQHVHANKSCEGWKSA